jgi:endogenous inhibitor of DNA gyrase (YacG/DUF329 family)
MGRRKLGWCRRGPGTPQFLDGRICVLRAGSRSRAGVRTETLYCCKRCRQAASRRRLKDRPSAATPAPAERCAWCQNPVPLGLRPEARYCSKRCRQASSGFAIAVGEESDTSRGAAAVRSAARRELVERLWAEGKTVHEIGEQLGWSPPRSAAASQSSASSATACRIAAQSLSAGLFAKPGTTRKSWARARHRGAHEIRPSKGKAARQTTSP